MNNRKRQYYYNYKFKDSEYPFYRMLAVLFLLCNIRAPPTAFSKLSEERRTLMKAEENENNKNFFKNVGNLGRSNCEYIIEAQNPLQNFLNEEKSDMADKRLTVNQFKKKVRVSLYNFRINIYKAEIKLHEREFTTDETDVLESESYDDYSFLENNVVVMDFKMTVKNDLLYEVLNSMEQHQRDIIYLSLCEAMSDKQIGEKLKMSRSKVQRIKQKLKAEIYNAMMGGSQNED